MCEHKELGELLDGKRDSDRLTLLLLSFISVNIWFSSLRLERCISFVVNVKLRHISIGKFLNISDSKLLA